MQAWRAACQMGESCERTAFCFSQYVAMDTLIVKISQIAPAFCTRRRQISHHKSVLTLGLLLHSRLE